MNTYNVTVNYTTANNSYSDLDFDEILTASYNVSSIEEANLLSDRIQELLDNNNMQMLDINIKENIIVTVDKAAKDLKNRLVLED